MAFIATKRSTMLLYTGTSDYYSQQVRMVLSEKNINYDMIDVNANPEAMAQLTEVNPYGTVPTLIDRELVLYQANIIMEYLDERFPHPPLLPVYPTSRGQARLLMYRIYNDWYSLVEKILRAPSKAKANAFSKELRDSLIGVVPTFKEMSYFMSEEFSLVDCCLAPLLWRLEDLHITLPAQAKPLQSYADKIFARDSFQHSISVPELPIDLDE